MTAAEEFKKVPLIPKIQPAETTLTKESSNIRKFADKQVTNQTENHTDHEDSLRIFPVTLSTLELECECISGPLQVETANLETVDLSRTDNCQHMSDNTKLDFPKETLLRKTTKRTFPLDFKSFSFQTQVRYISAKKPNKKSNSDVEFYATFDSEHLHEALVRMSLHQIIQFVKNQTLRNSS